MELRENIENVAERISRAAERASRAPGGVRLVAVTKTVSADRVREAAEAGLRVFGENRVQEARAKVEALGRFNEGLEWHMLGHLQRNKARQAVAMFELIHSVDSLELLRLVDREARRIGKTQRVLVEVKLSPEEAKHGVAEGELSGLLEEARGLGNVRVEGLMTMPPYFDDPELTRPFYATLQRLKEAAAADGFALAELSMGMTNDFEVAIEEGSTMVRVGTALFGARQYA